MIRFFMMKLAFWQSNMMPQKPAKSHFVFRHLQQVGVDEVVEVLDHDAADQVWIDGYDDRHRSQNNASCEENLLNSNFCLNKFTSFCA